MATWQTQEAKARFSELLDAAEKKGPQVITRRGVLPSLCLSGNGGCRSRKTLARY